MDCGLATNGAAANTTVHRFTAAGDLTAAVMSAAVIIIRCKVRQRAVRDRFGEDPKDRTERRSPTAIWPRGSRWSPASPESGGWASPKSALGADPHPGPGTAGQARNGCGGVFNMREYAAAGATMPNPRLCFSLPKSFRCRYGLSLIVLVIAGKLAGEARCNTQYFATMTRR
jgi:hypothetical protein